MTMTRRKTNGHTESVPPAPPTYNGSAPVDDVRQRVNDLYGALLMLRLKLMEIENEKA